MDIKKGGFYMLKDCQKLKIEKNFEETYYLYRLTYPIFTIKITLNIRLRSSISDRPCQSGFINKSSPKMHPTLQRSTKDEYFLIPSNNSTDL